MTTKCQNHAACFLVATLLAFQLLDIVKARGQFNYNTHSQRRIHLTSPNQRSGGLFGVQNTGFRSEHQLQQQQSLPSSPFLSTNSKVLLERLRAGDQEEDSDEESEGGEKGEEVTVAADESDDEELSTSSSSASSGDDDRLSAPVPVVIRAKYGREKNSVLDQKVDLTLQRRRTIGMVKDNLRRTLPNKPPVSLMKIMHEGRILSDDVLLDELVEEEEEDDDDEEDEELDDGCDNEAKGTLHLTLDMIPPVDGKFSQTLVEQVNDLTTAELLRLYATNEAALYETAISMLDQPDPKPTNDKDDVSEKDDDDEEVEEDKETAPPSTTLVIPKIVERANKIEQQLKDMLYKQQDKVAAILEETRPPSAIQAATEIRGERVIDAVPSRGVKTSLRRKLQHTFNVQSWADTIRYICLFIFFGMFGGRTPMSRLILLLGAPSVLVLQARPVKLLWKQALYTLINDPPGILLSLLPAPQQALFNLDAEQAMLTIYGRYTEETKELQKSLNAGKDDGDLVQDADDDFFDAEEDEEAFFDSKEEQEEEDEDSGDDDDDSDYDDSDDEP
eukprot:CAMPEP_0198142228 /NCGR_PEP_ID=MMETSP1443-20131203/5082_1 /TAXON_ID=186043 /ORGANISM="Entomoneis sp., Strain CCMP2396" /LENGTH=559 /DNA_ID=CAMNT_0043805197 /DNA_START=226 /DNA_END=1905 /DNA_ORIENTATION=+